MAWSEPHAEGPLQGHRLPRQAFWHGPAGERAQARPCSPTLARVTVALTGGFAATSGLVAGLPSATPALLPGHAGHAVPDIPPPPSAIAILGDWHPQPLLVLGIGVAAGLYLAGVLRLRRNGVAWNPWRTASWLFGLVLVAGALMSGLDDYADVTFSAHATQHMFLATVAPIPLALAAPLTLALRALSARPRKLLLRILHTPVARVLTFPLTGFVLMTVSLYAVYYSSLYPASLENPALHQWLHLHFLVSGCLFYWPIIGVDPIPGRLPYWGRLLILFISFPVHALFGLSLMSTTTVFGADYYADLHVPWVPDLLADQHTGGGIMWSAGELVGAVVFLILFIQWARADEREARRVDRRLDREAAVSAAARVRGGDGAGASAGAAAVPRDGERDEETLTGALGAYNARLAALARADAARAAAEARMRVERQARKAASRQRTDQRADQRAEERAEAPGG
jgi:putative membrane protein